MSGDFAVPSGDFAVLSGEREVMSGGPVFRWPSPSPAACELACGVDVLPGRFLQEHGPHHAVRVSLRLFPGGAVDPAHLPAVMVSSGSLIRSSRTRSCLWLRDSWPARSPRACGHLDRGRVDEALLDVAIGFKAITGGIITQLSHKYRSPAG